ncbi:glycine cleavage T (aminomethyltransferase) protein [Herbaspirillum rubrisubalbicans M1]|uniref:CAF17-like 4Fe-4S cluster assembly/insertion protein YgfZ n=1 Tax=Herbaspirillum rubrisubalbicans TaxID=80842 RepID=UPI000739F93A|nr:folate-binding protein YgfZ [Herbaspirillum rubrisubalbicans]ALU89861.1 glycine cleavage T (aminomethyltransferase) protein [Herbaspirillum rubrisubalbicans M1]
MTDMTPSPSAWRDFLTQQGAQFDAESNDVLGFGPDAPAPQSLESFMAPLTGLGLIAATGEEAASFLHGQLTNDVQHLDSNAARLAGYCSPKGRLLATLLIWRDAQTIYLQLPRSLQPAIQKRLQMFIMRAKAKLADAGTEYAVLGLVGPAAANALAEWFPVTPAAPYDKLDNSHGSLIRMADAAGSARYQWIAPVDTLTAAWPKLAQHLKPTASLAWRLSDIRAGVPGIVAATQEQFVPQMINFELIGGVNFKKGCYPGQEIVARSQYLGKLKRRTMLATIDSAAAQAGQEVFAAADPGQPCGMVVNAEALDDGRALALVEMKLAAADDTVHLGAADGPALHFHALPYELADPQ